ncbi:MAG TPA: EamA family transporter [Opitutus sp.]|nr:EamA family transporter [Opitutus sp.]
MKNPSLETPPAAGTRWWFIYAAIAAIAWGVWGAVIDTTARAGFPAEMGYVVWSFTMVPPALFALTRAGWRLERNAAAIALGGAAGLLGAGGQLILFKVLRLAPAYLVFPIIALSPIITVALAFLALRERVAIKDWIGILLALGAGVLLAYSPSGDGSVSRGWLALTVLVFVCWGVQGFVISRANRVMRAESVFFYMMLTGLLLAPVALAMVDFAQPINWGLRGLWTAAAIQSLNAIGALLLVYALRYGKAMVVAPLINAGAPMITILLSLLLYQTLPNAQNAWGMAIALVATVLLAWESAPGLQKPR